MAINDFYLESLKELYLRCCKEINVNPGSFLKKTIGSTKNKIHNAIIKSKYEAGRNDPLATFLLEKGCIRPLGNRDDQYIITAKGMWLVEEKYFGQNACGLIEELDNRFFRSELEKMTDKNRIILFATIAAHAFSENSGINYVDPGTEIVFIDLMKDSFETLRRLKKIEISSFESILNANNNQKKNVALLTSNIDLLPRSTYSLFISRKNCYYVNLINNQTIDRGGLKSLLKIIFEDIGVEDIDVIMDGCKNISLNYGCYFQKDGAISYSECNDAIEYSLVELAGL